MCTGGDQERNWWEGSQKSKYKKMLVCLLGLGGNHQIYFSVMLFPKIPVAFFVCLCFFVSLLYYLYLKNNLVYIVTINIKKISKDMNT